MDVLAVTTISQDPTGFAFVCLVFLGFAAFYAWATLASRRHGWHWVSQICFVASGAASLFMLVHFVYTAVTSGM